MHNMSSFEQKLPSSGSLYSDWHLSQLSVCIRRSDNFQEKARDTVNKSCAPVDAASFSAICLCVPTESFFVSFFKKVLILSTKITDNEK